MGRSAVILAAGRGSRLRGAAIVKPLANVAGLTLLEHAIGQARVGGCGHVVVVVGHEAEAIRRHLAGSVHGAHVDIVHNPDQDSPNGVSLLAAEPFVSGGFFLLMADHVFDRPVLELLAQAGAVGDDAGRLLVDCHPQRLDQEDATKVSVAGGRAIAIGKDLEHWNAVDAGAFLLGRGVFEALRAASVNGPPSVTAGMREMIRRRRLQVVEVNGTRWVDTDTPADLAAARQLFADRGGPSVDGGTV